MKGIAATSVLLDKKPSKLLFGSCSYFSYVIGLFDWIELRSFSGSTDSHSKEFSVDLQLTV